VTTSVCIPSSGLVTPNVVSDNVEIAAIGLVSGIFFYKNNTSCKPEMWI
jgi:hypothetical protein